MNTASRLGAFALALAAVFAGAVGTGRQFAGDVRAGTPGGHDARPGAAPAGHSGAEGARTGGPGARPGGRAGALPGGLQVTQDGYTLVPEASEVPADRRTDFRFTVTGPDGRPVTRFTPLHGKQVHFLLARRDLSGFQHLHPVHVGGGTWSVPLTVTEPGVYRAFADIRPEGAPGALTLGTDLAVPGDYTPEPLPPPAAQARTGDYTVRLSGTLRPGTSSRLTLTVAKDGRPVTDLEPYLEAFGHLVALRDGDLAYLHVHPVEGGAAGPAITFDAQVPSAGSYRLYLDFQHEGTVRTAEFTAVAAGAGGTRPTPAPPSPDGGEHGSHSH